MQHALVAHRPPPARFEPHGTFLMLTRVRRLGVASRRFRAVAHLLPPGSRATRAVNMCKAWATHAARSAQRSLDTYYHRPVEYYQFV
eukprot:969594-Prymnesium_polylepis.1